jgi:hypothetical protein
MSLSLLRRSSSIDSKLRCSGDFRFKNQSKIPSKLPTTPTIVAIIILLSAEFREYVHHGLQGFLRLVAGDK